MPRLLLVDDNPSIHKIAETLLAPTDVELVSCASGAEAMALVGQGEHFDVALLDTSMMGMDGWALLQQIRATESTARLPVAMMAGVLDTVDPDKLRNAPIQGFLKKPVELRDLGERVKRLMETPVLPPPAPPAPVPAAPEPATYRTQPALVVADHLRTAAPAAGPGPEAEDDLLLLGPEDLFAETEAPQDEPDGSTTLELHLASAVAPTPPAASGPLPELAGEPLDLEELDFESLRGMTFTVPPLPGDEGALAAGDEGALAPGDQAAGASAGDAAGDPGTGFTVPEFLLADTLPESALGTAWDRPEFSGDLPDLGPALEALPDPAGAGPLPAWAAPTPAGTVPEEAFDWSDESDSLVGMALAATGNLPAAPPHPETITLSDILDAPADAMEAVTPTSLRLDAPEYRPPTQAGTPARPEPAVGTVPAPYPADDFAAHAATPAALPALAAGAGQAPAAAPAPAADPLQALLADPALMDRLARAVVARLGDQALREIAWEVMPELAARLHAESRP